MEGEEGEHDVVPRAVCDEERPCARAARGAAATPRLLLARAVEEAPDARGDERDALGAVVVRPAMPPTQ